MTDLDWRQLLNKVAPVRYAKNIENILDVYQDWAFWLRDEKDDWLACQTILWLVANKNWPDKDKVRGQGKDRNKVVWTWWLRTEYSNETCSLPLHIFEGLTRYDYQWSNQDKGYVEFYDAVWDVVESRRRFYGL